MIDVFGLPIKYYKQEGFSTYSIAYSGALAATIGGLVNIVPSLMDKSTKCVIVDVGMIVGGLYAANVLLQKADIVSGY
jgi:hypothetical protein